jgi:hypothetical protein
MALEERKKLHEKVPSGSINFQKKSKIFFFNDQLHRVIKSNAPANTIHCLNYETKQVVKYTYSDYKKFRKRAYIMSEVTSLVRRSKDRIFAAIKNGDVKRPVLVERRNRHGIYYFSEDNIYELREHFATTHRGRPRKDGLITVHDVPTKTELDILMGKEQMLYIRTKDGEYVPVWKAEDYD